MNELNQLKPKLNRLKMSGILEHLDIRIRQAEEEGVGWFGQVMQYTASPNR